MTRARRLAFAALLGLLACGDPDFRVHVVFEESVAIERGAPVMYQGVVVGEVEAVSLWQESPDRPARVELTLAIEDPEVTLREADLFQVSSRLVGGATAVQITPSPDPSPPLAPGARVAGVPPLATRVSESVGAAIDAITELATQKAQEVLDQVAESMEEEGPPRQAPPPPPAPPVPDGSL